MDQLERDLDRFYTILGELRRCPNQGRPLREQTRQSVQFLNGVYFFHEPGEYRSSQPDALRIVRVGTHAVSSGSKATLWQRLRTHKGAKAGGGNHRGSVFRLHVGAAMHDRDGEELPNWGKGKSASTSVRAEEAEHERRVSEYIGAMPVFWVDVPGAGGLDCLRSFIERNAIALLSNHQHPLDHASPDWLGWWSSRPAIRGSALWNVNHVDEAYESRFLDTLEERAERTARASEGV